MKPWQNLTDLFNKQEVNNEMVKKYRNTILAIHGETNITYAKYEGVEDGMHSFIDQYGTNLLLAMDTEYDVTIPTVRSGMYNTKMGVVKVSHNPYRQYRKGICADRIDCRAFTTAMLGKFADNIYSSCIYDILNQKTTQVSVPIALARANDLGAFALNRTYVITKSMVRSEGFDLFYKDSRMGSIDNFKITIDNKLFLQELCDSRAKLFPNHGVIVNG